ncbi:MAG: biotin--[acetyl-CoA-carboxylase] ligase [Jejuia sp.]
MPIIKLNAIDSTNSYLRGLIGAKVVEDFTVVTAKHQTNGRGQRGSTWMSEPSKNLMFSVFIDVSSMKLDFPFYLSMATALAIRKSLYSFLIPQLHIKWPNDILSHHKKICGVLIENVIKQGEVSASIIGIGINVNQTDFEDLPNASSLKNISGKFFDLDEVLNGILVNLKHYITLLRKSKFQQILDEYNTHLFRKNKPSTFRDIEGNMFSGYIQNVSETGDLQVLLEDNIIKSYELKEVSLLY